MARGLLLGLAMNITTKLKWVLDQTAVHLVREGDDRAEDPVASIFAEPTHWRAETCQFNPDAGTFNVIGTFESLRLACRAVEAHVARHPRAHGVAS